MNSTRENNIDVDLSILDNYFQNKPELEKKYVDSKSCNFSVLFYLVIGFICILFFTIFFIVNKLSTDISRQPLNKSKFQSELNKLELN